MIAGSAEGEDTHEPAAEDPAVPRRRTVRSAAAGAANAAWRSIVSALGDCFRYRVTGLAAEAAFFAILSLPPLVFGLAGTIGYIAKRYQVARVDELKQGILDASSQALTDGTVSEVVKPTLDEVLAGGRIDVISVGFLLALWSGSRALNVIIDTITIMYGLGGRRGIVKARMLSFTLYVAGLLIGIVVVPLILAGPDLVRDVLPDNVGFVERAYWPIVILLTIAFLTTLYHLAVPVRTSWAYGIPGAAFTMLLWIFGSMLTRWVLQGSIGGTSIYGPLSAPIAVLLWLYVLSIALLFGAALNAAVDRLYPSQSTVRARTELLQRLRERAVRLRRRSDDEIADELNDELPEDEDAYAEELAVRQRWFGEDALVRRLLARRPRR